MKTVYILIQHLPNGKQRRCGVWVKRVTAETNQKDWEKWVKEGIVANKWLGSTFEIIEEKRFG